MVFSMNVLKNKKRWQNRKTLKSVKKTCPVNKKTFFTSMVKTSVLYHMQSESDL